MSDQTVRAPQAEPNPPCPTGRDHCAHPTGMGFSQGFFGGSVGYRCCECGAERQVGYRDVEYGMLGHGPHVTVSSRVYDWPEGWKHFSEREPLA